MSLVASDVPPARLLGRIDGPRTGPALVVVAGIHGNEPAGVEAATRVLTRLQERSACLAGTAIFLRGNLSALHSGARFVHKDLNRQWTPERLSALDAAPPGAPAPAEDREQWELLARLRDAVADLTGPVYFLDLHTSSADGPPFLTIGDTLRNRRFALSLPLPIILGLEEQVDGSLLELLNNRGFVTLGVEAGRHGAAESIDRHEAVLWLVLVASGLLRAEDAPDLEPYRALLRAAAAGIPPVIEVRHRHAIQPADQFRMHAGYVNFQPVERGQPLAHDRHGEIRAPEQGLILLPLYQGQGDDGFFIARAVSPFWLRVSELLRRSGAPRLLRFLPGVRRVGTDPEVLVVDKRTARFYPLEIFHLCGYRKRREQGRRLLVSRRSHDLVRPSRLSLG